ncbi:MAG: tripartite tricarboxylate transporter TctB family protein [Bdellovibrionota bacterium]
MINTFSGERLFLTAIITTTIITALVSLNYDVSSAGAGLIPLICSLILISTCLYRLLIKNKNTHKDYSPAEKIKWQFIKDNSIPLLVTLNSLFFIASLHFISYYLGVILFLTILCIIFKIDSKLKYFMLLGGWIAFVFIVFDQILQIELP